MTEEKKIRPRERDAIIQSLKSGVTPKIGIQHIQVGRVQEISAVINDIDKITQGGCAFRLIIGSYGSGKTFFLSVMRAIALEKKLVTIHADLSPDRRLHATSGQARNLYSELMRNMSTRTKPDGSALVSIVEKFIVEARKEADRDQVDIIKVIESRLKALEDLVGGYDFAKVIEAYWRGHEANDEELKANAVKWLRAEYTTVTDARKELGIRTIISDHNFYDSLKLMSLFIRQAGYNGLLVNLDELVNLYKLSNTIARTSNYEQILRILNDCLQGTAEHIGFLLGGTQEFLQDPKRGLYSYEALHSRLADNNFAKQAGVIDYSSPSLYLANLTPEELFILLKNIRHVYANGDKSNYIVDDESIFGFLKHCSETIGDAYFRTPRNTIKSFLDLLAVLDQNKSLTWESLLQSTSIEKELATDVDLEIHDDVDLTDFRL